MPINQILIVTLIQLYWFSFILIGAVFYFLLWRLKILKKENKVVKKLLLDSHPLVSLFILFCSGVVVFVPLVSLGYIFEWPLLAVELFYVAWLLVSVIVLIVFRHPLLKLLKQRTSNLTKRQVIIGLTVLVALGLEYAIGIAAGHPLDNDTPVHLAKIQQIVNMRHLNLGDPFMGYNGIIDWRYSTNILHALQATISNLLGIPAYKIWFYSYAFYRLVMAVSIFALARVFLRKKSVPNAWLYAIMVFVPLFDITYLFNYPELPHSVVIAWSSLLFIGLKIAIESNSYLLFMIAITLTAATHAISAFYTVVFIVLLLGIGIVARKINRKQFVMMVVAVILLALPIIPNIALPARSTVPELKMQSQNGFHGAIETAKLGPIYIPKIQLVSNIYYRQPIDIVTIAGIIVLGLYVLLARKIKSRKLRILLLVLITIAGLEISSTLYLSVIGFIYLIRDNRSNRTRAMLVLLILFYALIIYNPIVLTLAHGNLPLWLVSRFQELNTFAYIAPLLGLFLVFRYVSQYVKLPEFSNGYLLLVLVPIVSYFNYLRVPLNTRHIFTFDWQNRATNTREYNNLAHLSDIDFYTKNKVIFSNDYSVISRMAIASKGMIGLVYNPQSNQMENYEQRTACYNDLLDNLYQKDLLAAKVEIVVLRIDNSEKNANYLIDVADRASYLEFQAQVNNNRLYRVIPNPKVIVTDSVCNIPYKQ